MAGKPVPSPERSRDALEDYWRVRVRDAHELYKRESANARNVFELFPPNQAMDPGGVVARHQALQRESEALREYMRRLRVFTDLVLRGVVPNGE